MIKYKINKKDDVYILFRYRYHKNSIGFYKIKSGGLVEIRKFLKENNIKVGIKYDGN